MKKVKIKDNLVETGKNLGSGLVGMVAGSAVGRHSLWIGAVTIFGGAWYQRDWLTSVGVGMVASNGFGSRNEDNVSGIDGFKDELNSAKNRALSSLRALGKKVYLDKLSPSIAGRMGLDGMEDGTVLMLDGQVGDIESFDTTEVDEIIRQLEEGNVDELVEVPGFEGTYTMGNPVGDVNGDLGALDSLDVTELAGADALQLNAVA